ncbi:MAG TPA: lysophospholipid acyltransferase family protein [Bacteroidota bacterium]|nr:lysophospholipid acyltransferase family protein [Bacteroidota bacterium]
MTRALRSLWVWAAVAGLITLWLPLLALIRLFDTDPVRYTTGRWFRRLGVAMTRVNPSWRVHRDGETIDNPRRPYVVVSNHQSLADIPIISHLPWEMKWIGKAELFSLPFVGWMMKLAGDIPVDRADRRSGARMLLAANRCLQLKCSVMFFPEGTRSPDGRVWRFNEGAFHLAIKAGVPLLPVAIEGTRDCLPKRSWKFGPPQEIRLRVLPPVETSGLSSAQVAELRDRVREMIIAQIALWRGEDAAAVDALREADAPAR